LRLACGAIVNASVMLKGLTRVNVATQRNGNAKAKYSLPCRTIAYARVAAAVKQTWLTIA